MDFAEELNESLEGAVQQDKQRELPAVEMSMDEASDILDRYDGFEELLGSLADDLDKFSPGKESKKKRYLQDEDLEEERAELKGKAEAFLNFLLDESVENHKSIRTLAQKKLDENEALINENVDRVVQASRDLERTYREMHTFFINAEPQQTKNVTLFNVNPEALTDADSDIVYNAISERILRESKSVDQRKAFSMLVVPGLHRGKRPKDVIERYAKLCGEARMSFLTDFAETDSVEDTLEERESKRWQGFTGSELFHSKLIMFANHMMLRGKHEGLSGDEDMKGSVAMAVAGKMYAEKISQPIMGEKHGALSNSAGLSFHTTQEEVTDLSEVGLNSTMNAYDKDMVYDSCTAFDGAEYPLKRYPVVRTFDYVNRVLRHYLGRVTGQQLDQAKANHVRETIQDFLNQLVEQKIISAGKVAKFAWNKSTPDRIDVDVDIQPLWAVRTFVYSLKAAKGSDVESDMSAKD